MKHSKYILLYVILPILCGGLIYVIFRSSDLIMFSWFDTLGLDYIVSLLRSKLGGISIPDWIRYSLPDFLWAFSFTSAILLLSINIHSKKRMLYILIPLLIGCLSEIGQLLNLVPGTYDRLDLILYFLGGILSISAVHLIRINKTLIKKDSPKRSLFIIMLFIFLGFGSNKKNEAPEININLAYNYAQGTVREELNFPPYSEFPDEYELMEHIIELGQNEFLIDSWIDSISASGDKKRHNFSCKVTLMENDAIVQNLIIH